MELHYYELCFYHDEDDNLGDEDKRFSVCIKTEIPPVIPDDVALEIMLGGKPPAEQQELVDNLTCVMEISEEEARHFFDVDKLIERHVREFGSFYSVDPLWESMKGSMKGDE